MKFMYYKWMYLNRVCAERAMLPIHLKLGVYLIPPPFHECYFSTSHLDVTIERILFIERVSCEIYIQKGYVSTIFLAEIYV